MLLQGKADFKITDYTQWLDETKAKDKCLHSYFELS